MTRNAPPAPRSERGPRPELPADAMHITHAQQQILLNLARASLVAATSGSPTSGLQAALDEAAAMREPAAVFVTLTENGNLRGCVGSLEAERSLPDAVVAAAVSASLRDPRFFPVTRAELPSLHVEISVLGRPVPFAGPDQFRPGVDGLIVERGMRRALLLPQVATDWGWGAIHMLEAVCEKAGLDANAWMDERTRVSSFRTVRFGGPVVPSGADSAGQDGILGAVGEAGGRGTD
jgi:uncharacterized protein